MDANGKPINDGPDKGYLMEQNPVSHPLLLLLFSKLRFVFWTNNQMEIEEMLLFYLPFASVLVYIYSLLNLNNRRMAGVSQIVVAAVGLQMRIMVNISASELSSIGQHLNSAHFEMNGLLKKIEKKIKVIF